MTKHPPSLGYGAAGEGMTKSELVLSSFDMRLPRRSAAEVGASSFRAESFSTEPNKR
jgi:hypothetical protein